MELSSLGATLSGVAAASARIETISAQATGQASLFASVLSEAQAVVDREPSPADSAAAPVAQERRASLATLMALRGNRPVTLGQALSVWEAAASVQGAGSSPVQGSFGYDASVLPMGASWAQGLPPAGRAIAGAIDAAAKAEGVDPRLLASLVWAESSFHQGSVSHAGAQGLTQLMPATAAGLGVDASDPEQNLRGGARYLKIQLDRFGSAGLALAAYNAGPGRVRRAGGIPDIPQTQGYVRTVLGHYRDLGGLA